MLQPWTLRLILILLTTKSLVPIPVAGAYSQEHCPRVYAICRPELGSAHGPHAKGRVLWGRGSAPLFVETQAPHGAVQENALVRVLDVVLDDVVDPLISWESALFVDERFDARCSIPTGCI
jgi:hypothetical protein